jgi:hypothetical protein
MRPSRRRIRREGGEGGEEEGKRHEAVVVS